MKSTTILISTLTLSLFLFSCGNTPNEQSKNEDQIEEHNEHENHDNHQQQESVGLKLNNGEKWVVNEEMKPFVAKGQAILEAYTSNNNNTDYKTLAKEIKEQNNQLISSCTMDGESHDELHVWLLPHLELVDTLSKTDSQEEADKIISQLTASYSTYKEYFQ